MDIAKGTGFTIDDLGFIQIVDVRILTSVAQGRLDLNDLARQELANRGLDVTGAWVGFDRARDVYERRSK